MIIDVHAHYDDEAFSKDLGECLKRAKEAGVKSIINAATNYETSLRSLEIAKKYEDFYCVLGIHPEYAETYTPETIEKIKELIINEPKAVGVGETGLDYYWLPKDNPEEVLRLKALQKVNFIEHINVSEDLGLPLVVHDREAHQDTLNVLKENVSGKVENVLHCYSGSAEMVRDFTELNMSFSVGGVITFKNAVRLAEAVKAMPRERILIETDSPYLTPVPYRGKRNDSSYTVYTARRMAEILDVSYDYICRLTTENALRVFGRLH
ncbi:MAG: TatD family deoxyribonuclease [Ruminococcaceae bacterium]|nr:TatD family deoxyribonuclease [Oscillospiraceae bacterium]